MKAVSLEKLLPGDVPAGEQILWHGRPQFVALARRAYRADFVAAYFAALTVWSAFYKASDGFAAAPLRPEGPRALAPWRWGLIGFLAYLSARTTLYVVTSRRLVMKIGVALPIFINVPFNEIASASLRVHGDSDGDIPVALTSGRRIGYWVLWPHARPLRFARPEPTLRCISNAAEVAETLARALNAAAGQPQAAQRVPVGAPSHGGAIAMVEPA